MEEIEIVTLTSDDWEKYKILRLRALKEEPQAYLTSFSLGWYNINRVK